MDETERGGASNHAAPNTRATKAPPHTIRTVLHVVGRGVPAQAHDLEPVLPLLVPLVARARHGLLVEVVRCSSVRSSSLTGVEKPCWLLLSTTAESRPPSRLCRR